MGADTIRDLRPEGLPGVLADIARATSVEVAVKIAREWHGERYIPVEPARDHPLSKLVGVKAARLIGRAIGGGQVKIRTATAVLRHYDARRLRRAGLTLREIARAIGVTEEWAGRLCAGVEPDNDHALCAATDAVSCPLCGHHARVRKSPASPPPLPLFPNL